MHSSFSKNRAERFFLFFSVFFLFVLFVFFFKIQNSQFLGLMIACRVYGRIQSPGDKAELLIRTRRKFLIVYIGFLIYDGLDGGSSIHYSLKI